jgi:hypothetical protein
VAGYESDDTQNSKRARQKAIENVRADLNRTQEIGSPRTRARVDPSEPDDSPASKRAKAQVEVEAIVNVVEAHVRAANAGDVRGLEAARDALEHAAHVANGAGLRVSPPLRQVAEAVNVAQHAPPEIANNAIRVANNLMRQAVEEPLEEAEAEPELARTRTRTHTHMDLKNLQYPEPDSTLPRFSGNRTRLEKCSGIRQRICYKGPSCRGSRQC